jgi:hypothetical protein
MANRPDIIIKTRQITIPLCTDGAIPLDRNVIQKEAEKKFKYKNLSIEFQRMWNMKFFFIPIIIGITGIVSKGLKRVLEEIPGKYSRDSLKKHLFLGHRMHKERAAILDLKAEYWGAALDQEEKYQGKGNL